MPTDTDRIYNLLDKMSENQADQHQELLKVVTELQTQMTSLIGNGQPGRIDKLEKKVDSLISFRAKVAGYVLGISATVSSVWAGVAILIRHYWK